MWEELEEVDVDVALDCDFCVWAGREDVVDGRLDVLLDLRTSFWVVFGVLWSSVEINNGVCRIGLLFGVVELDDASVYVGDGDFV